MRESSQDSEWDDLDADGTDTAASKKKKKKKKRRYVRKPALEQRKGKQNPNKRRKGKGMNKHRNAMTDIRWRDYINNIANGMTQKNAIEAAKTTRQAVEAYIITHSNAMKQLREAELVWLRRYWSLDLLDIIFTKISTGRTVKSVCAEMDMSPNDVANFYKLMRRDPVLREQYDLARELQAESWMDDTIDIADQSEDDRYVDKRGMDRVNHDAIQRSRLRVDTRQWTMGVLNRKRFGDRKHIDVDGNIAVNHAVVLGAARKRLEATKEKRLTDQSKNDNKGQKQGREVIEGEYSRSE